MARQYSHRQFFRRVPNPLLARYFHEKQSVLDEFSFDQLKETEVEPIFQALSTLPPDKQAEIEAEFQDIDTMACEGGVKALADEAHFHGDETFSETLSCPSYNLLSG